MWKKHSDETSDSFSKEFGELYQQNYRMVLQVAFRTTGNKDDAENVLQTVFLRILERPELQPEFRKNPKGYLYRAAINEALNVIGARERQQLVGEDVQSLEIAAPDEPSREYDIQRVRAAL